jgi:hypothetical protein
LCVCSILRTIAIFDVYWGTYDITWAAQGAWIWLTIEAEVAVICASAPALKSLFLERAKSKREKSNGGRQGSGNSEDTLTPSEPSGMRELKIYDSGPAEV